MTLSTRQLPILALLTAFAASGGAAPPQSPAWSTVVNNGDYMPTAACDPGGPAPTSPPCRTFNSYNQPSVNADGVVVLRARSRGGQGLGQNVHGVYVRDMAAGGPVRRILDRDTLVPPPNNRDTTFIEPPSFPRIDIGSDTLATRGNHAPVWKVLNEAGEIVEQVGTSGIYANPFGDLITAASKLGSVADFWFFEVPELPGTAFDVFPGAPAVTNGNIVAFKGNYTEGDTARTGVYFRELGNALVTGPDGEPLTPAGGSLPVTLIANSRDTFIPGTTTVFGSTAPPSAANRMAVFAGFDNEDAPTVGGIYLAPLSGPQPALRTLVGIGDPVPGANSGARFNKLGEGVSFDGRFVAFWGAWGTATRTLVLQCPTEGNAARIAYCNEQHPDGFAVQVPLNQGVFVHDIRTRVTRAVARTPARFADFLFWNFSGRAPGVGEGEEGDEDDGELARWRASAFVAVNGRVTGGLNDPHFHVVFKARTGTLVDGAYVDPVDGIYLGRWLGKAATPANPATAAKPPTGEIVTLVETGMAGTLLDPEAIDTETGAVLAITEVGIERDGFRGKSLVINASMGSEETGWAGIYLATLRQ